MSSIIQRWNFKCCLTSYYLWLILLWWHVSFALWNKAKITVKIKVWVTVGMATLEKIIRRSFYFLSSGNSNSFDLFLLVIFPIGQWNSIFFFREYFGSLSFIEEHFIDRRMMFFDNIFIFALTWRSLKYFPSASSFLCFALIGMLALIFMFDVVCIVNIADNF